MRRFSLFIVFCFMVLLIPFNSNCQKLDGYVVLSSGDTLFGMIKQRSEMFEHLMHSYVVYFNKEGEKKKFYKEDIRAYKVGQNEYYVIPILGKKDTIEIIGKRIISGKCELFEYWFVTVGPYGTSAPMVNHYMRKEGEVARVFRYRKLVKGLDHYFADAPKLNFDIQRKKYKKNEIDLIIMRYNNE